MLERELGGGGMARVFVAEETALGRRVVVKVLAPELAEGLSADRFEREVRLAARLQHPHIVPLLAAGALSNGALYYTMPFVEGEGLADRLAREGALPVDDAVRLLRDVASALAYAHRHHVVHRDVKPANVLVCDGGAMVADFGIAKAISASRDATRAVGDGADASRFSTLTAAGTSLGTPAYMAPEQALGDAVDHRADLYALGVLAYELLTGRPPFDGRTAQQLLAAHAVEAPEPLARRRPAVPPGLAALVMRCLEKTPADRPQSADEICRALDLSYGLRDVTAGETAAVSPAVGDRSAEAPAAGSSARHAGARASAGRRWLPWTIAGVATALAGALGALLVLRGEPPPARMTVTSIEPPPGARFVLGGSFALSPDGSRLAFVAQADGPRPMLWLRSLDSLDAVPIRGTDGAQMPFWSPDGTALGFFADGQLKTIEASGGGARTLCAASLTEGGSWGGSGVILFAPDQASPLQQVPASGGACVPATAQRASRRSEQRPSFLPDGRHFVFSAGPEVHLGDVVTGRTWMLRTRTGEGPEGNGAFVAPDLVVFYAGGSVYAQRLDLEARRLTGEPRRIAERVTAPSGTASFSASQNGLMIVHVATPDWVRQRLVRLDRRGNVVDSGITAPVAAVHFRYSRRGDRVAFAGEGLFVHDLTRDVATRLATGEQPRERATFPLWSPGDSMLVYAAAGRRLQLHRLGRDTSELLFAPPSGTVRPSDWSADGRFILFSVRGGENARVWSLWIYSLEDRSARPVFPSARDVRNARFSPDGEWLAYESEEGGGPEVYLRSLAAPDAPIRVSTTGGSWPRWRQDGRELVYSTADGTLMTVAVKLAAVPVLSVPRAIGTLPAFASGPIMPPFEASPDGQQFSILARWGERRSLTLLTNWQGRLRSP